MRVPRDRSADYDDRLQRDRIRVVLCIGIKITEIEHEARHEDRGEPAWKTCMSHTIISSQYESSAYAVIHMVIISVY